MVEVLVQKETKSKSRANSAGHAGSALSRSVGDTPAADSTLATPYLLKKVGHVLNGTHWQADFAKEVKFSKAQITRWLNGSRAMPATLNVALQQVILDRIIALAKLLQEPGMPLDAQTGEIVSTITEAAEILKIPDADDS